MSPLHPFTITIGHAFHHLDPFVYVNLTTFIPLSICASLSHILSLAVEPLTNVYSLSMDPHNR
jgi:hypothetical protein